MTAGMSEAHALGMETAQLVRIDFAEFSTGRVTIDGRTAGLQPGARSGPFTVRAVLPRSLWGVAAGATLAGWADRSSVVVLRFRQGRDGRQVQLNDGRFVMLLDLETRLSQLEALAAAAGRTGSPGSGERQAA